MEKLLCPSMMCANYRNLEKEVNDLIEAGVDIFHIDIMDGQFVPNFGMGLQDVEYICKASTIPVDAHLMIEILATMLRSLQNWELTLFIFIPNQMYIQQEHYSQL